jgi:predicted porin
MKKTLVAIAALAAFGAQAQSSVQLDGIVDAGYQSINYKGNSVGGFGGNGSSTSQLNVRGTEDLGGGLKASFRVETDWNMVSNKANTGFVNATNTSATATSIAAPVTLANANSGGGTFGNGEIRVGLAGSFGEFHIGAPNNFSLDANLAGQSFGTAIGSGFRGVTRTDSGTMAASAVRFDNAIKYITPTISGVTGGFYYVKKNAAPTGGTAATSSTISQAYDFTTNVGAFDYAGVQELSVKYANGPLNAIFVNQKTDAVDIAGLTGAAGFTKRNLNTLGVNYTMGAVTGYLHNQTFKAETSAGVTAAETSFTALGAKYVTGSHTFMAQTGSYKFKATNSTTAATIALVGKDSKLTAVGYDYNLSKTSAVYARYESINDEAGAITKVPTIDGADTKRTRTALGLRVAF